MNVEIITLNDGGVILAGNEPFPYLVKRVEYYNEQRLFLIVYNKDGHEGELLEQEVPERMCDTVAQSPDVIIYSPFPDHEPIGYKVPLVKVGALY